MSLLKTNEIQNYNGSSLTLTASTVSTSAQLNTGGNISVTGSLNVSDDSTTRTNLGLGSMATQNANAVAITGGTINTVQPASGQSLTIKDEDGNTAITVGTDNTAASYLSLNFGSHNSGSGTLTANILSDYEEGTYTPTYTTSSTDFTSVNLNTSVTGGKYVKIGNMVYASGSLYTTSITVGAASGTVRIGNLPFNIADSTVAQNGYTALMVGEAQGFAGDVPSRGRGVPLTDEIDLFYKTTSNGNTNSLVPADLGTGANANLLRFTIVYVAS